MEIKQLQNTGMFRFLMATVELLRRELPLSLYRKRSAQVVLPAAEELCPLADISPSDYWKFNRELVSKALAQIYGSGRSTRYELRRPAAFLKYFEQCYLRMAAENYYIPYLFPREVMTMESRKQKLTHVASRLSEAKLELPFVLHSGLEVRGVGNLIFRPREIELIGRPDNIEEVEDVLGLTPILSHDVVRAGRPFLQSVDVVVVMNRLSSLILHRYLSNRDGRHLIPDLLNLFELRRYQKRGEEAAECFWNELIREEG